MNQRIKSMNPVYKDDMTNRLVEVGDTVTLVLKDGTTEDITVNYVSSDGRWIGWDRIAGTEITREEDVRAVDAKHAKSCFYYGGYDTDAHSGGDAPTF